MSVGQFVASALLSIVVSATTVVVMHLYVTPKLPVVTVEVPQVSGLTTDQARAITEPLGLLLVLDGEKIPDGDKVQTGALFEQKPLKGSRLTHGGEVHAFIAIPPQLSTVPALVGQVVAAAEQQLQVAGLRLGTVTEEISATIPPGQVISTRPAAGEKLRVLMRGQPDIRRPHRLAAAPQEIGQLTGDHIRQPQHQELSVRIGLQLHSRISRQRRPSRCISINASSGPEDPGS